MTRFFVGFAGIVLVLSGMGLMYVAFLRDSEPENRLPSFGFGAAWAVFGVQLLILCTEEW
jgi:hypothetical protein